MKAAGRKQKGAAKERASKALLEAEGWRVTKAGGSLGSADLIALKHGERPLMVQVKACANPYGNFRPAERAELLEDAKQAGAVPLLAWWAPRARTHKMIESFDWP